MKDNGPTPIKVGITTAGVVNYQIALNSTVPVYTDAISLCDLNDFALTYKVTCTGTPSVKIELQQAIAPPTSPNAADANYVTPEGIVAIESALANQNVHHKQLTPVTVEFYRFKLTELTNIVTDTVVNLTLSVQRKWAV